MTVTHAADPPPDSGRPADAVTVFVGGCDRSGTTVVGRLVAETMSLVAVPEAYFHAVAYRRNGPTVSAEFALRHWRRRSWGLEADGRGEQDLAALLRSRLDELYRGRRGDRGPIRVVECTPENIEIGSILLEEFPEAHLIHLVRDPRSVAASLRRMDFGPSTAQECARFWKQRVASGLALELRHPDRVHRVRYEDLVRDPAAALAVLRERVPVDAEFEFDLDRDVMVDITSAEVQRNVRGSIDPSRIDAWRGDLDDRDVAAVEFECRELMLLFDYELVGRPDDRSATRRRLDNLRSVLHELTIDNVRRAVRIGRSFVRRRPLH